ncbi:MAG: D-sedoheptulose 7-phosphate isomerase [Desulfobacterales bacterium]|jgi:D-sedoheptulose 7-phosphate isomerase
METHILQQLEESIQVKRRFIEKHLEGILLAVEKMVACVRNGNKILIFGNGGSAADAQHLAAEFVNRFKIERPPLAAIALTTDTSILTSIGNDYRFDDIFSKQIEALAKANDIAWGISTSGNSKNILRAIEAANERNLFSIGFTGRGGALAKAANLVFAAPSDDTARIQEAHITLGHIICDLVERMLFSQE